MSIHKGKPTKDGRCYYFTKYKDGINHTSKKYLTRSECEKAQSKFLLKVENPINKRFDLVAEEYFNYLSTISKETTIESYNRLYNNHIYPFFKQKYINNINTQDIVKWANIIEKKGFTIKTMNMIRNVLKLIFDYAIKMYGLEINPVIMFGTFKQKQDDVKCDNEKLRYITKDEFDKFISVIDNSLWKTWFITIWYTGCRKSELRALTWNDIDFNNDIIIINKNLNDRGVKKITSTKNNINRTISMNNKLRETLFNYKKDVIKYTDYKDNWFVFGGSIYLSRNSIDRAKDKYFKLSGVRRITNHEFRHSIITYLANSYIESCNKKNINIDTEKFFIMLAKRDGHSVETLKRNYLHLFPSIQNEIVDLLDNS